MTSTMSNHSLRLGRLTQIWILWLRPRIFGLDITWCS